jgi:predicted transposase YdaD
MGIEQLLLQRAETKGEKRGEKIGDDRRKSEVIRKARLNGATLEFIANITDLSVEQVKAILSKMGIE